MKHHLQLDYYEQSQFPGDGHPDQDEFEKRIAAVLGRTAETIQHTSSGQDLMQAFCYRPASFVLFHGEQIRQLRR